MEDNSYEVVTAAAEDAATNPFSDALWKAFDELNQIQEDERKLTVRKAQLKQTVNALYPLVFPDDPDIRSLGLADAIRLVIQSDSGRGHNARDVRRKLEDVGYDLSRHNNPLASIHTAIARMVETAELVWVDDENKKVGAGPEMKTVPEPSTNDVMESLGLKVRNESES